MNAVHRRSFMCSCCRTAALLNDRCPGEEVRAHFLQDRTGSDLCLPQKGL
jgi:hypothetical protein